MEPMWSETDWQIIVDQSDAVEFDWYAQDRLGNIASFSSYGRGAIPIAAKSCRDSYNELYDLVATLPEITDGILVYDGAGRYDDWVTYARQGLFGYDYQDAHRTSRLGQYDLLTCPLTPVHIESLCLPPGLRRIVPFVDVEFGRDSTIPFHSIPQ